MLLQELLKILMHRVHQLANLLHLRAHTVVGLFKLIVHLIAQVVSLLENFVVCVVRDMQQNLANFNQLVVTHFVVDVGWAHFEVRVHQVN